MNCPECNHPDSAVSDTRRSEHNRVTGLDSIRRRRECSMCAHRFTTIEVLAEDWPDEDAEGELSPEALHIASQVVALLDARLAAPERTARQAAEVLMRYNPHVSAVDLRRALGVSAGWAHHLHNLHHRGSANHAAEGDDE